jgi:serine/threonine protein phosphatase 1
LRGNHEQMLIDSAKSLSAFSLWIMNGGNITLRSFNVSGINQLDPVYLDFFNRTGFYVQGNDFIAVHAGLNFNTVNPLSDRESMLWIRDFIVDRSFLDDKILIHGHTPMDEKYITSQRFESPLNIDGGCVYKNTEGMGNLFALDFNNQKMIKVNNID